MGDEDEKIISGSELNFTIPDVSLGEYLMPKIKSQPRDHIIEIDSETGVSQTAGELLKQSLGLANGLINNGLKENDVVALVSKNRSELSVAVLATIWANGVPAPIDSSMKVYELKHMFGLLQPKYVVAEDEALEDVEKALNSLGTNARIVLYKDDAKTSHLTFPKLITDVDVESFRLQPIASPSTQLSLIMPSSGTTGLPKGVGLTHRNIIFQMISREIVGIPLSQVTCLQLSYFFWLSQTMIFLLSVATGMRRILVKDSTEDTLLKAIHTYKPMWGVFAPSTLGALMNHPDFTKYDVSSIKMIQPIGSVVTERLIDRIKKEWSKDLTVRQLYGITELTGVITEADPAANVLSVGKLGPGIKLKVVDVETKKSLGPNKVGELCFKTEGLMKCYVGNPEITKDVIDGDGWYHTGDLGYYDDNEYLYIVDRIKEMIKVRNMQVAPAELENLIETLPGVLEAGVIGVPNEKDGYHPMALIVKQEGSNITEDDVIRIVKENLSESKHLIGGVKFVRSIPRTTTGKIKRKELKGLAESLYRKN